MVLAHSWQNLVIPIPFIIPIVVSEFNLPLNSAHSITFLSSN